MPSHVVRANLYQCFRGSAQLWYKSSLDSDAKLFIMGGGELDRWRQKLAVFCTPPAEALGKLTALKFGPRQMLEGQDPTEWFFKVRGCCMDAFPAIDGENASSYCVGQAWNLLDAKIQVYLPKPTRFTTADEFLETLLDKRDILTRYFKGNQITYTTNWKAERQPFQQRGQVASTQTPQPPDNRQQTQGQQAGNTYVSQARPNGWLSDRQGGRNAEPGRPNGRTYGRTQGAYFHQPYDETAGCCAPELSDPYADPEPRDEGHPNQSRDSSMSMMTDDDESQMDQCHEPASWVPERARSYHEDEYNDVLNVGCAMPDALSQSNGNRTTCQECQQSFPSRNQLYRHLRSGHLEVTGVYMAQPRRQSDQ
jgi:hypothetical protein